MDLAVMDVRVRHGGGDLPLALPNLPAESVTALTVLIKEATFPLQR